MNPIFQTNYFKLNFNCCDKASWIKETLQYCQDQNIIVSTDEILKELEGREAVCSTFIGQQTSLPHIISNDVYRSGIYVFKNKLPVTWDDENEVNTMVIILVREDESEDRLKYIPKAMEILADDWQLKQISEAKTLEELMVYL